MTRRKTDDEAYREWIRRQPSCISGRFSEWVDGEGRSIAAHVRRAATSGTAFKAPFSCVPLTHDEHLVQHQKGEAACLDEFFGGVGGYTAERAKEWFDEQAAKYRKEWERLAG